MSAYQTKVTRHTESQKKTLFFEETEHASEPDAAGMLELSDEEFKRNYD